MKFKAYREVIYIWLMAVLIFIGVGLLLSIPLTLLWNWLMPNIFGLPTINILEAFGLSALISLLKSAPVRYNKNVTKEPSFDIDKYIKNAAKKYDFQA